LSTSENTDFDDWLGAAFRERGSFTAYIVLVEIGEASVAPLCSTYLHVIGDEVDWGQMTVMLAGSGYDWDGAVFFIEQAPNGGPLDNVASRLGLKTIEEKVTEDRLYLNSGNFFDKWGRRMQVEEIAKH